MTATGSSPWRVSFRAVRPPRWRWPSFCGISSRTPEGERARCPICRTHVRIEPSLDTRDAACPRCGHLLWFGSPPRFRFLTNPSALRQMHEAEQARARRNEFAWFVHPVVFHVAVAVVRAANHVRDAMASERRRIRPRGKARPATAESSGGVWDHWLDD